MDNKKIFVKDLTTNEKKKLLNFISNEFEFSDIETAKAFQNSIINYISKVRRSVETFERNVPEIIELLTSFNYSNDQIIKILINEPSLLHANKSDLFWRLLLLEKVIDRNTGKSIRVEGFIKNPRILRTSQELMYSRIKYLSEGEGINYLRNLEGLSVRQIIKSTNQEFENSYHISKEKLIERYPFDNLAQLDVISWPDNSKILDRIYENGRSI